MFARFGENPAMTLRIIKETKSYGRTDRQKQARMHRQTDGQRENSIPTTNKVCGGIRMDGRKHARTHNMKTVYPPQTKFAGGIISRQSTGCRGIKRPSGLVLEV